MLILTLLAAHEGEEFVIILPAIMLVGAFFILRWANKNDTERADDDDALPSATLQPDDQRPVGLVLPKFKASGDETAGITSRSGN